MRRLISMLFESYSSDIRKLELKIKGLGYKVNYTTNRHKALGIEIKLPNNSPYIPDDLVDLSNQLEGHSNLLMIDAVAGNEKGNYIEFLFPYIQRNFDFVYHVSSEKNIESISEKGLLRSRATDATDNIIKHKSNESFRDRKYKAVFTVSNEKDAIRVQKMFNFDNPHLIKMDAKGLMFYNDPLMPEDFDSIVHFSDINPNRIVSIIKM